MTDNDIAAELRRGLRNLAIATCALYVVVIAAVALAWWDASNKRDNLRDVAVPTLSALCTLRADVERRADASEAFLADHPEGIDGITAASIRTNLDSQRHTVEALSGLKCP